ncbi:MAG: SurA N-terminal domain-containing protein [Chloroflexi bacterium]|nr:SurA N-terminal domain-containing protein [Chloroflexota bacterium]
MVEEAREIPRGRVDRRRLMARRRPEDWRTRRVAIGVISFLVLLVLGLLVAGYVVVFVRPPSELVIRVNDVSYSRGDMVKLLRVRQRGVEFLGGRFNAGTDIFQALQLMVENEIIAQAAPALGITVSEAEVDREIRSILSSSPIGKTEDQLEKEFRERYRNYLNAIQISGAEYSDLVRRSLLRERMRQFVGESVPSVAEQVHVYRLIVDPRDELDIIRTRYEDAKGVGSDPIILARAFMEIVREFSRDDPEIIRRGGDLGWMPEGVVKDYDYVYFDLPAGELSEDTSDVDSPQGRLLLFMVSERQEARQVDPRDLEALKEVALQDWLNKERQNHDVYSIFNSEVYNWMIRQLGLTTTRTPEPRPSSPFGF